MVAGWAQITAQIPSSVMQSRLEGWQGRWLPSARCVWAGVFAVLTTAAREEDEEEVLVPGEHWQPRALGLPARLRMPMLRPPNPRLLMHTSQGECRRP